MSVSSFCSTARADGLLVITIERPQAMNALPPDASVEMSQIFDDFADDPELHVAIVTGAGDRAFCAGNDLKYQAEGNRVVLPSTGFGGLTGRFDLDKPVIAAVNGAAMGGGFEIVLACDLVVAADHATFALPEPSVGMMAGAGGLLRLPRIIPTKLAMEVILTGRRITASEGARFGFVNQVVQVPGKVLDAARELAARIQRNSPMAIRASKHIAMRSLAGENLAELYPQQKSLAAARALYESEDFVEGPRAFAEKRAPRWRGR